MKHRVFCLGLLLVSLPLSSVWAATLDQNLKQATAIQSDAAKSQQQVDRLSEQTQQLLQEYNRLLTDSDYQKHYLDELRQRENAQRQEIASLNRQLESVRYTQQKMGPLLKTMLEALEQFVVLDLPFHHQQRINGLLGLRTKIEDGNLPISQKYRLLMEAFQIEMDYGNTMEAYRDRVNVQGKTLSVEVLRVGRIALFYQSLDGKQSAMWNKAIRDWQSLDESYHYVILNGIRVAKNQLAPQLLNLPIPTVEEQKL